MNVDLAMALHSDGRNKIQEYQIDQILVGKSSHVKIKYRSQED